MKHLIQYVSADIKANAISLTSYVHKYVEKNIANFIYYDYQKSLETTVLLRAANDLCNDRRVSANVLQNRKENMFEIMQHALRAKSINL